MEALFSQKLARYEIKNYIYDKKLWIIHTKKYLPNFCRCSIMESSVWCLSATSLGEDLRWQNSKQQFWSTHLSKRWKRAKVGQKRSLRQGSLLLFIYFILYITLKVQVLLHRAQLVDHLLGGHHPRLPPLQIGTATGAPPPSKVPGAPPPSQVPGAPPSQVHYHLVRFQVHYHLVRFQVHHLVRSTIT